MFFQEMRFGSAQNRATGFGRITFPVFLVARKNTMLKRYDRVKKSDKIMFFS